MDQKFFEFLQKLVANPKSPVWTRRHSDGYWERLDFNEPYYLNPMWQYHVGNVINNVALPMPLQDWPETGVPVWLVNLASGAIPVEWTGDEDCLDMFNNNLLYATKDDAFLVVNVLITLL